MATTSAKSSLGLPSKNPSKSFWHTEPSKLLLGHRTTEQLPQHADVVIIGSGITGASAAWHLFQDHNHDKAARMSESDISSSPIPSVVMLEAREACFGATGRNGGHCQPILFEHPHDASIGHFELANFYTLQSLIKELNIDCELYEQHGVRAIYSESDLDILRDHLEILEKTDPTLSARTKLTTDRSELASLRVPTALGAVVTNIAGRMWPYKFVAAILENLLTSPITKPYFNLHTTTPVTSIIRADDAPDSNTPGPAIWKLSTPRGQIVTPTVILATNAYTSALVPEFTDLIVPCRGQMSAQTPPDYLAGPNRLPSSYGLMSEGQDDYLIQRPNERGGHLMFGGGRQYGPSLGVSDDEVVDDRVASYLRTTLGRCLGPPVESKSSLASQPTEALQFPAPYQWTGIMGFSRDSVPWVGPLPSHPGIFMSAGYTGHGMPNAWLCGRAVSWIVRDVTRIITGSPPVSSVDAEEVEKKAVDSAIKNLGIPKCYILTKERLERVRIEYESVEIQDRLHAYKREGIP